MLIQLGKEEVDYIGDNIGINISNRNGAYNELSSV